MSRSGAATVRYFESQHYGDRIRYQHSFKDFGLLAVNQIPTNSWQTPNVSDSDAAVPVNAKEVFLFGQNSDNTPSDIVLSATSTEWGDIQPIITIAAYYQQWWRFGSFIEWIQLGPSRKIYIAGANGDDNALMCYSQGHSYGR